MNYKDLLLKDICSRLPYNIRFPITVKNPITSEPIETTGAISSINRYGIVSFVWDYEGQEILVKDSLHIKDVKPYLFPLSSMTKEQKEEFNSYFASVPYYGDNVQEYVVPYYFVELLIEFFHKNHIDNNGLIPKGLANDATGKNIY